MIETLFSLFFIATTLLLTSQLLITATRLQQEVEKAIGGTHLADQLLGRLRANAEQSGTPPTAGVGVDPDFPGYRYQVEVIRSDLYTPCSTVELQFPANERRVIPNPGTQVKVTVTWDPPLPRNRATAYGLILKRLPTLDQLNISADSANVSPVGKNVNAEFAVNATDTSNQVIPGVFFHWYCNPKTGNGLAASKTRNGSRGQFTHIYKNPYRSAPIYFPVGSECLVQARARYNGKEFECNSPAIPLTDI